MPNILAYIVVFSYPLVVVVLFRKLSLPKALIWSILGGYLFLPQRAGIDLPLLPELDKSTIPALSAAVMVWLKRDRGSLGKARGKNDGRLGLNRAHRQNVRVQRHGGRILLVLLIVVTVAPFATFLVNQEAVVWGPTRLPAMRLYDSFSMSLSTFMALIPFLLARKSLATPEAHREILKSLVFAGLAYSLFILIEVRLSPQLNRWIYGFFPHSFIQHIRGGGFRPIVFLDHGLRVGIFIAMAIVASCSLIKMKDGGGGKIWMISFFILLFSLVLSKTLGALLIAFILLFIVLTFSVRVGVIFSASLALIVMVYPMARSSGLMPLNSIASAVRVSSAERAESLIYRLDNEENLLNRANQKPLFGWGLWYRNGIFDKKGERVSVTDGTWIIQIGVRGWVGYLGFFGLLCLPIILLTFRARQLALDGATAGLMVVLTANLVDLIPNSSLVPITWMIAGALAGRYELGGQVTPVGESVPPLRKRIERKPAAANSRQQPSGRPVRS